MNEIEKRELKDATVFFAGTLGASISLVSIIKRAYAIELYGMPATIYSVYAWFRELVFWPVPISLTWRDAIVGYTMIGLAALRSELSPAIPDIWTIVGAVLLWPLGLVLSLAGYTHFSGLFAWGVALLLILVPAGVFFGRNHYISSP